MGVINLDPTQSTLDPVMIHDVLRDERRQLILGSLRNAEGRMTTRELSELIASDESGESPSPQNARQSA